MTDLRKAAEQALEALDYEAEEEPDSIWKEERDALRQALAQPVDAVNISQERVDETAKDRLVRIMGTFDLATGHADTMEQVLDALEDELRDVLGHLRVGHKWVGLTELELRMIYCNTSEYRDFWEAYSAKLKEKSNG